MYTGFSIDGVTGNGNTSRLNAVTIDLSDIGVLDGAVISAPRIYSQPVGIPSQDKTAGADIVVVGALNLINVREPCTPLLFAIGLSGLSLQAREKKI